MRLSVCLLVCLYRLTDLHVFFFFIIGVLFINVLVYTLQYYVVYITSCKDKNKFKGSNIAIDAFSYNIICKALNIYNYITR